MKITNSILRDPDLAGSGGGGADWTTGLDEGAKTHVATKGYKTPGDVVKAHIEAERLIGTKRLAAPAENWKPEQWDSLYSELGRPVKADGYTLPDVKLPDGLKLDDDVKIVRDLAHKMGLNQRQAGMLLETFMTTSSQGYTMQADAKKQAREAGEQKLRETHGDKLDGKRGLVNAVLAKHGNPEFAAVIDGSDIGNNPELFNFLLSIGTAVTEDTAGGRSALALPPATRAQMEIQQAQGDVQFMAAYYNGSHPNHTAAVARMSRLYSEAHPGTQKFE